MSELISYKNPSNTINIIYISQEGRIPDNMIFKESCKKNDVNFILCHPSSKVSSVDYGTLMIENEDGKFEVNNENSVVFCRKTSFQTDWFKSVLSLVIDNDFPYSNKMETVKSCINKYSTFEKLSKNQVSTIPTIYIDREIYSDNKLDIASNLTSFLDDNGFTEFPIVIKITNGTEGKGVFLCPDKNIASSILQYVILKQGNCIIQKYCKIDNDIRVHVFCKSLSSNDEDISNYVVVGAMKRNKAEDDFRTNYSVGGSIEPYDLSENEAKLACEGAKAIGAVWCGVDICHDELTGNDYIIEINSTPSLKGITSISQDGNAPSDNIVKLCKNYFESTNSSYIDESNKENILFITKNPLNIFRKCEYGFFYKECKALGVNLIGINPDDVVYKIEDNNLIINGKKYNSSNTVAFFRHSIKISDTYEQKKITSDSVNKIKSDLNSLGIKYSNSGKVGNICRDKYKTHVALLGKVPIIPTIYMNEEIYTNKNLKVSSNLLSFLHENEMELPLVVKITDGTQGLGVFCCNDENILVSIVQYLVKTKGECIIQKYCSIDNDIRVHVLCKSFDPKRAKLDDFIVVGAMKRDKAEHDFRTNFSIGANVDEYSISESESEIAKMAAKAIGAVWCGVDICYDKLTDANYVIEVNSSPALRGITSVSKVSPAHNIVKSIKEYFEGSKVMESKDSTIKNKDIFGKRTTIHINGIGDCEAILDSGNAGNCSIRTKSMEINGNEVKWDFNGKTYTSKIIDNCRIQNGGDKGYESRPIIYLDFDFNGKQHKNVKVSLKLNPHRADYMLLSAGFLGKNKIIIDPSIDKQSKNIM